MSCSDVFRRGITESGVDIHVERHSLTMIGHVLRHRLCRTAVEPIPPGRIAGWNDAMHG